MNDDGRVAVNPDGALSLAWWLRDGDGRWQPWMRNTFRRVAD